MRRAGVVAAVTALVAVVYALRLDPAAGLYVDDAWYIVLARALWEGEGFRLISSATTPLLPAFPPGFPMILAPVVGVFPDFPDNVTALKMVSIVAMFGVGIATYHYLLRSYDAPPFVAGAVAVITVLTPAFVFLATSSVMAEATFTLAQLGFALAVDGASRGRDESPVRDAAVCGVIAGVTLLIRLAGIATIAAGVLFLARRRGWRTAAVCAAIAAACYAPWAAYAAANRAPLAERAGHGGSIAYGYAELVLMRHGGEPGSGRVTPREVPGRVLFNVINILGRDAGAFVFPAAYRGADESGQEVFVLSGETGLRATGMGTGSLVVAISLAVSAVVLIGFARRLRQRATVAEYITALTIAMVVLVPARTFRYILPLAPFMLFYFFCGIETIAAWVRPASLDAFGSPFRVAAASVLALMAIEHVQYIQLARNGPPPAWLRDYEEAKHVTDWINANVHDRNPIASSNPGLIYLTTGRKTVALSNPRTHLEEWQQIGVGYAVALHVAERPPRSVNFEPLYESPRLKLWVMKVPARPDRK
jgi:hypothetical protein